MINDDGKKVPVPGPRAHWLRRLLMMDDPHRKRHQAVKDERGLRLACPKCGFDLSARSFVMIPPPGVRGIPAFVVPFICPRCGSSRVETGKVVVP